MFDKILLPIDINHPESWEKAIPAALQCSGEGGEIHLLGIVHDLGVGVVSTFLPADFEKKAMEGLKAALGDLVRKAFPAGSKVQTHVGHGHVPETILRIADQVGADLIVMSSHPPSDLRSMLVGSYADKVVHHAPIPVLTVR
ncbi:universal stress protein [Thalassococcus sp. CAU 1522]|uniref:Universal stress protein n=1 Tax=Thalassococcus arenae TaxID=2851652 RepID=A0ABS6NC45_9RHOB|nr:universal stress protein [Thalassococcus arenae]MBV2361597.1 universal stress protein [Thalassococcus arenae]